MRRVVLTLVWCATILLAGDRYWVINSSVKSRSLALGSAFMSMRDAWTALPYNPAGFVLDERDELTVHVSVNPAGLAGFISDGQGTASWTVPVSLMLHGIGLSNHRFDVGLLLGDESFHNPDRHNRVHPLSVSGYAHARNYTLGGRFILSQRVSLGFAADLMVRNPDDVKHAWGYRYGILLSPKSNFQMGLCYFDLPNKLDKSRMTLERIPDETLNLGVTYCPVNAILVTADIRNVSDEDKEAAREPHLGMEVRPMAYLSLRAGYYKARSSEESALHFGIGFKNFKIKPGNAPLLFPVRFSVDAAYVRHESIFESDWIAITTQILIP